MKTKAEIEFHREELVRRVEAFAHQLKGGQKLALPTTTLRLPQQSEKTPTPAEVVAIRQKFGVSQAIFARLLNVPKSTVVGWETGARKPTGAALKLLRVAERNPEALELKAA